MVDRHREHPGDAACKGHDPVPAGPDRASEFRGQIEPPVPCVGAGRCIWADDPPGDRRLQAEEEGQFDKHVNLFARRPANVSTRDRQGNPFAPVRADDSGH